MPTKVQKYRKEAVATLTYANPIRTADGLILSVDMVTADYSVGNSASRDELVKLLDELPIRYAVQVTRWETFKIGRFRCNYTVMFQDGNSFYVGLALNAAKTLWPRCRLEFNPNKVARHAVFLSLLGWVNDHSSHVCRSVCRFDLAVDIPIARPSVRLVKDRRVYYERRHGAEWTEYLGPKSSNVGRCKLYNKTAEAELPYSLTRLEMTLDPETPYEEIPWPRVYYIDTYQMALDELQELTDTQRFVLGALMEGYGSLHDLGRRTREKLTTTMRHYCKWVTVSEGDYCQILAQLRAYLEYPCFSLALGDIDPDQQPWPSSPVPDWVRKAEEADRASGP